MSARENKALIRRFYEEVWDQGNSDFAYEVFADDYVRHDLRPTRALPGPEGQKKIADDFRAAFPDLRVTVDLVVGDDDYVVGRWTASGTHLGAWGGSDGHRARSDLLCSEHLPFREWQGRRDLEPSRRLRSLRADRLADPRRSAAAGLTLVRASQPARGAPADGLIGIRLSVA
jgi:predicted ester cyclase